MPNDVQNLERILRAWLNETGCVVMEHEILDLVNRLTGWSMAIARRAYARGEANDIAD